MITMNKPMTRLLKGRVTQWSLLALVLAAAGFSLAWNDHHYQLGGTYVGGDPGLTSTTVLIPLDPDGRTASDHVVATSWGADFQSLLGLFGADTFSDAVGESRMISRDTGKYTHIGYLQAAGNPLTVKAIGVISGTAKFTGPNTLLITYTLSIYPPTANGVPNLEQSPLLTTPEATALLKRVPVL